MPGNRVLLRSANKPMLVACWFAVMKAGGIAVATMPMLRAKELKQIIEKGQVDFALCDETLRGELEMLLPVTPVLQRVVCFGDRTPDGLEALMARHDAPFANVDTAADDTCLLAFTSGTTGQPKATMHFHRDVMASCVCFPTHVLRADAGRRLHRQPAARLHLRPGRPDRCSRCTSAPRRCCSRRPGRTSCSRRSSRTARPCSSPRRPRTARWPPAARERRIGVRDGGALRKCVSAGEVLPAATRTLWREATGIELIDGIGATEMLHIFISADEAHARPGATGKAMPGYRAKRGRRRRPRRSRPAPIGRLAVQGPHRLPLPRRRAPGELRAGTAGTTPATPT